MTKHLSAIDMARHTQALGVELMSNRAELAPQLAQINVLNDTGVSSAECNGNSVAMSRLANNKKT